MGKKWAVGKALLIISILLTAYFGTLQFFPKRSHETIETIPVAGERLANCLYSPGDVSVYIPQDTTTIEKPIESYWSEENNLRVDFTNSYNWEGKKVYVKNVTVSFTFTEIKMLKESGDWINKPSHDIIENVQIETKFSYLRGEKKLVNREKTKKFEIPVKYNIFFEDRGKEYLKIENIVQMEIEGVLVVNFSYEVGGENREIFQKSKYKVKWMKT